MNHSDYIQRILFEDLGVRCVYVRLEKVQSEVLNRGDYPVAGQHLLAEALLVAGLMSSGLKFSGRISLQLKGEAALRLLVADCTDQGGLRGMLSLAEPSAEFDLRAGLPALAGPGGILTLTLDPSDGGQRWQGMVPIEGETLADAIAGYFDRSEQLPTRFRLAAGGRRASALMIQRLPGEPADPDGWNRMIHLLASVSDQELLELAGDDVLRRLFHAEVRRVFPARALHFHCPCSRERVAAALLSLGIEELADMAAEPDPVEVRCQFCNQSYRFDPLDLVALQRGDLGAGGESVH